MDKMTVKIAGAKGALRATRSDLPQEIQFCPMPAARCSALSNHIPSLHSGGDESFAALAGDAEPASRLY